MNSLLRSLFGVAVLAASGVVVGGVTRTAENEVRMVEVTGEGSKYWSRWRGPSGQGHVTTGKYRDAWSPTAGVKWKTPVRGSGNSSPIVWKDRIFLTTAENDAAKLSLLVRVNAHGARTLASPALADNTWYWRTEDGLVAIR